MDWPLVKITWIDSCEPYGGWRHIATLDPPPALECITVGFLVRDDERTKTVVPHLTQPFDEKSHGCGILVIPVQAILSTERLGVIAG